MAMVFTALAVLLRWLLNPWLGDYLVFATVYGAVALAVWFGGYLPALLAVVLGFVGCAWLFLGTRGAFGFDNPRNVIAILLYLLSCGIIVAFGEAMHVARRRSESQRRQLEQEASEREQRVLNRTTEQLQTVTDSMAVPVTRCSRDLRFLWANKAYADLLGRSPEEIVERPIIDVIGGEAFDHLRPRFEQVLSGKKVVYDDVVNYQGIGRRWINAAYTPTLDNQGNPDGWVAVVMDITERKRAEEEFRHLADAMPQIVWAAQPDGYIDYYNERWYEYTGFSRGEYGQQSWEPILHPDDVRRCVETYFGCVKAGRPYQIEYRFKERKTGDYRWHLGRALPVRDESGQVVRWFGTCTDIDDTKKAGERLRDADRKKDGSWRPWRTNSGTRWRQSVTPSTSFGCWARHSRKRRTRRT
jgi:PAS domain S-box-containing protein